VDWSFECVGHPAVVGDAVAALDWGGNCVIIGVPAPTAKAEIPITHLTHIDRGVRGCRYGGARPHHDIPLLVQLYLDGKLKLDELVSKTYPLEAFGDVVDDMHAGRLARGVLTY
jgi:S-(hydroxymethyl)glutathione dehydrogenase/alcohol dehydrogenase